ncbi:MAG: dihydropteroate synthase [Bacillota bacterium]
MRIISGRINTSLDGISDIINARDEAALLRIAKEQIALGAQAIDLNCATHLHTEIDDMLWMIDTLQKSVNIALGSDSPNPELHIEALKRIRTPKPIINSTSLEKTRIQGLVPSVKEYNARLIVLLHDESGMPAGVEDRLRLLPKAEKLMRDYKLDYGDVFLDPLMFPVAVDEESGMIFLKTMRQIKKLEPRFQFICGMDNVSYGMPEIEILNIAMMFMLAGNDMDAVMLSLTPQNAPYIPAIHALTARPEGVIDYIDFFRRGKLNVFNRSKEFEEVWFKDLDQI